jgi:hypothetical protein
MHVGVWASKLNREARAWINRLPVHDATYGKTAQRRAGPPTEATRRVSLPEPFAVGLIVGAALLLLIVPYLMAGARTPHDAVFLGQMYAIPDTCIYFSWIRQVADGQSAVLNLFTNEPQHALPFNLFVFMLGWIVRVTGLSIPVVYTIVRVVSALATLLVIARIYRMATPVRSIRLAALAFAAFGGGFAWIEALLRHDVSLSLPSVDSSRPEALVFTSLYASPATAVATMLIAASLCLLMLGATRARMRYAVAAGLCLLLLGNLQNYDLLQVATAWICYLAFDALINRGFERHAIVQGLVAAAFGLPSVAYHAWAVAHESVFRARSDISVLPAGPSEYVIGYGLLGLLAVLALMHASGIGGPRLEESDLDPLQGEQNEAARWLRLMVCWSISTFVLTQVVNAPFAQMLILGEGIPIAFLAGYGAVVAAAALNRFAPRWATLAALCLIAMPSSVVFVLRDLALANQAAHGSRDSVESPYVPKAEVDAFAWLRAHSQPGSAAVMPEAIGQFYPGFAGRPVWAASVTETPGYTEKRGEFSTAIDSRTPPEARSAFLAATAADWLVYPTNPNAWSLREFSGHPERAVRLGTSPVGLTRVYGNREVEIYRIAVGR